MPLEPTSGSASYLTGNDRGNRSKRSLTCANCRLRKTRCDGSLPGCKTCEVYKVECRYEKPPPMSQIIAMASRLEESERTINELRTALQQATTLYAYQQTPQRPPDVPPGVAAPQIHSEPSQSDPRYPRVHTDDEATTETRLLSDLSLDENGKLCYYGPTSAVHAPAPEQHSKSSGEASMLDARMLLTSTALESKAWEEFALGNAAMQTDIPRPVISRLLRIHWAWITPMFNWVYRPAFMRDMAIGGPFYSPFLLTVMCAHAARFDSTRMGELLISRARHLLGNEIHRPSSIPAAQALLQLSARDLAYGSMSQAWLYSGMAFRMVSDLGLHHSTMNIATLGPLSAEDLEIRRRLFWSCYFWDKAISLYLGRMPVLLEVPFDRPPELVDDSAENDLWSPHSGDSVNLSNVSPGDYPHHKSYVVSSFENCCKLAVILNDIILHLYSRRGTTITDEVLRGIQTRLDQWRTNSPPHLRYDPDNLPETCPPPHILTQNMLYFTTIILLHRPFHSINAHHATCRAAADSIQKLVLLLKKTFGFTRITYLMAYCVYTGASVMVQDVAAGDLESNIKVLTFLEVLKEGTRTCPIVQRSLDIINNGLKFDSFVSGTSNQEATTIAPPHSAGNYLPAFPYCGPGTEYGPDPTMESMEMDGVSLLDNFPETQFESLDATGTWFFPE